MCRGRKPRQNNATANRVRNASALTLGRCRDRKCGNTVPPWTGDLSAEYLENELQPSGRSLNGWRESTALERIRQFAGSRSFSIVGPGEGGESRPATSSRCFQRPNPAVKQTRPGQSAHKLLKDLKRSARFRFLRRHPKQSHRAATASVRRGISSVPALLDEAS